MSVGGKCMTAFLLIFVFKFFFLNVIRENLTLPANDAISVGVSYDCWWQMHDSVFAECDDADL